MMTRARLLRAFVAVALVALATAGAVPVGAQTDADVALRFFEAGGAYCFRVVPEGVALSEETEWTLAVLTSAANRSTSFRVRTVDPGRTRLKGDVLANVGMSITNVWRRESLRESFFERFATGIRGGILRARTVKIAPPQLAEMKPPERAELYLKFADRGSRVDFGKSADLNADGFLALESYLTD